MKGENDVVAANYHLHGISGSSSSVHVPQNPECVTWNASSQSNCLPSSAAPNLPEYHNSNGWLFLEESSAAASNSFSSVAACPELVTSMGSITAPTIWPMSSIPPIQANTDQQHAGVCQTSLLERFNPGNTEHGRQLIGGPNEPLVDRSSKSKAKVVIIGNKGGALIHIATENGHAKMLKLLLQHKADYNAGNPATSQFIMLFLATKLLAI